MKGSHIQRIPSKQVYNMRPEPTRTAQIRFISDNKNPISSISPKNLQFNRASQQRKVTRVAASPVKTNQNVMIQQSAISGYINYDMENNGRLGYMNANACSPTNVFQSSLTKINGGGTERFNLHSGSQTNSQIYRSQRNSVQKSKTPIKINYQNPNPVNYYHPHVTYITPSNTVASNITIPTNQYYYPSPKQPQISSPLLASPQASSSMIRNKQIYPKAVVQTKVREMQQHQYIPIEQYINRQSRLSQYPQSVATVVDMGFPRYGRQVQERSQPMYSQDQFTCNYNNSNKQYSQKRPYSNSSYRNSEQPSSEMTTMTNKLVYYNPPQLATQSITHTNINLQQKHINGMEKFRINGERHRTDASETDRQRSNSKRKRTNLFQRGKNRDKQQTFVSEGDCKNGKEQQYTYTCSIPVNQKPQEVVPMESNWKIWGHQQNNKNMLYLDPAQLKYNKDDSNVEKQRASFKEKNQHFRIGDLFQKIKGKIRHSPQKQEGSQSQASKQAPKSKPNAKKQSKPKQKQQKSDNDDNNNSENNASQNQQKEKGRWRDKLSRKYIKEKFSSLRGKDKKSSNGEEEKDEQKDEQKDGQKQEVSQNDEKQRKSKWRQRFGAHHIKQKISGLRKKDKKQENPSGQEQQDNNQGQQEGDDQDDTKSKRSWRLKIKNSRVGRLLSRSKDKKGKKQEQDQQPEDQQQGSKSKSKGKWRQRISRKNIKQKFSRFRGKDDKDEQENESDDRAGKDGKTGKTGKGDKGDQKQRNKGEQQNQGISGYLQTGIDGITKGCQSLMQMVSGNKQNEQNQKKDSKTTNKSKGNHKDTGKQSKSSNNKNSKTESKMNEQQTSAAGYSCVEITTVLSLIIIGVAIVFIQIYR